MTIEENLTYLQKVALKGEIGFALSTATHDAEIKFRTYLILKEVQDQFKPFILECIKESVTFDEDIIDRIYLEILNDTVPVWLWIDQVISDIKLHITSAEMGSVISSNRLSIDKLQERKNLVESAFVLFVRETIIVSTNASEQLLNQILDDYDLEFLHNACFYLKSCCAEIRNLKGEETEKDIPDEIMSCLFDIRKTLSFAVETKSLSDMNKRSSEKRRYKKITNLPLPTEELTEDIIAEGSFTIDGTITHKELSQYISEKIVELFEGTVKASANDTSDKVYVVKKVFTDSGITTDIRTCQTQEEAINFIKKIIREYPELTNVCEFKVCVENRENHEKNKWGTKNS